MPNVTQIPEGRTLDEVIKEMMPAHVNKHYHFAESEVQAAYKLVSSQYKSGLYRIKNEAGSSICSFGFKVTKKYNKHTEPEIIEAIKQIF